MIRKASAWGGALGALLLGGTLVAQTPADLQVILNELQAIRQAQAAVQKELNELKALVQARPASAPAPARAAAVGQMVSIAGAAFQGRSDAPLTLVEFSDFQCPFCGRHVKQTMPQIVQEYIDTGKLKYVFRHFPLESIHAQAFKASEASECAADQRQFWPMHDRLFVSQAQLGPSQLPGHAAALGLNAPEFERCLASGKYAAKIRKDLADGQALGITGTPAFMLGRTVPGSQTVKVEVYTPGARAYAGFKQDFERLLGQANP